MALLLLYLESSSYIPECLWASITHLEQNTVAVAITFGLIRTTQNSVEGQGIHHEDRSVSVSVQNLRHLWVFKVKLGRSQGGPISEKRESVLPREVEGSNTLMQVCSCVWIEGRHK